MTQPTRTQLLAAIGETYEAQAHIERALSVLGDTEAHGPDAEIDPLGELRGASRVVAEVTDRLREKVSP